MAMLSLTALAAEEKTAIAPPLADTHIAVFGTTFCLYPTTDMKG